MSKWGKTKKLTETTNCTRCEARHACPDVKEEEGSNPDCPLFQTFKESVVHVLRNPLMYLSKKAAELDVQIQKQQMIDKQEGHPLNPLSLKATQVVLEAVKIAERAQDRLEKSSNRGRKVMGKAIEDDEVIDADWKEIMEDKK